MDYLAIEQEVRQQCSVFRHKNVDPTDLYISMDIFVEMRKHASTAINYDAFCKWTYLGLKIYLVYEPSGSLSNHIEVT